MKVYIIGSLRNPTVSDFANLLRLKCPTLDVFDDWMAAGERGDDEWRDYEKKRGRTFVEALEGRAAEHTFSYDKHHLDTSDAVVLVAPAGKSAFLELGYMIGRGKPSAILLDDPERWDLMFKFADFIDTSAERVVDWVRQTRLSLERAGSKPHLAPVIYDESGASSGMGLNDVAAARQLHFYRDDGYERGGNGGW